MASVSAFPGHWRRKRGSVSGLSTSTVLQIGLGDFRSLVVHASFFNVAQDKTKNITFFIEQRDGNIFSQVGPKGIGISLILNPYKDGTVLKIDVTNNEGYDIRYNWLVDFHKSAF